MILSQCYYICKLLADWRDAPSHRSKLYWCLLDKIILFHFYLFLKKACFMLDAKGSLNHRVIGPILTWSLSQIRPGAMRMVALLNLAFGATNMHYIAFNTKYLYEKTSISFHKCLWIHVSTTSTQHMKQTDFSIYYIASQQNDVF